MESSLKRRHPGSLPVTSRKLVKKGIHTLSAKDTRMASAPRSLMARYTTYVALRVPLQNLSRS
jgi:hypothetical protein